MGNEHFDPELDDLLKDLHQLLDDDTPLAEPPKDDYDFDDLFDNEPLPQVSPEEKLDLSDFFDEEEPEPEPAVPTAQPPRWTEKQAVPAHVAKLQKNEAQAYADWLYEQENNPTQVTAAQLQQTRWTDRQKVPRHVAKLQQNQAQAYADWLYEQDQRGPEPPPTFDEEVPVKGKKRKKTAPAEAEYPISKKKKRHGFRNFLIFLLVLALVLTAVVAIVLPKQPAAPSAEGRRAGASTILLIGTDASGARTDTLMLLSADQAAGRLSLVSIPRDTLVNGSYTVPKINSVYGVNGGGAEGIEMLMTRVEQCVGFRPDGYILVRLDAFADFVDALGGVEFDVPVDMFYNDPTQDLYIALEAGKQLLTGEEALGVVRFRSGYADADLGRVRVQRDLLSALIDQTVSVKGVARAPLLLEVFRGSTETDLTAGNFLWLAKTALTADLNNIETATLPGSARNIGDGSYYILDPASVVQTVNTYCNPLDREITTADLEIRQG